MDKRILLATCDPDGYDSVLHLLGSKGFNVYVRLTYEGSLSYSKIEKPNLLILTSRIKSIDEQKDDLDNILDIYQIPFKLVDKALKINPSQKILHLDLSQGYLPWEYNGESKTLSKFVEEKGGAKLDLPIKPSTVLEMVKIMI